MIYTLLLEYSTIGSAQISEPAISKQPEYCSQSSHTLIDILNTQFTPRWRNDYTTADAVANIEMEAGKERSQWYANLNQRIPYQTMPHRIHDEPSFRLRAGPSHPRRNLRPQQPNISFTKLGKGARAGYTVSMT